MYQYINNILSIPARLLYEDWKVMSYSSYRKNCYRGKLVKSREGKGEGNEAMLSYYELPNDLKELCKEKLGDPNKEGVVLVNFLEDYIVPDTKAASFFVDHTKPDGSSLKPKEQRVRTTNCCIFNAIKSILEDKRATGKAFGKQRTMIWNNIAIAVKNLDKERWEYKLPENPRILQKKYNAYLQEGYSVFIHAGEGNQNTAKIKSKEQIALLEQLFAMPQNLDDEQVKHWYNLTAQNADWESISSSAVGVWRDKLGFYTYSGSRGAVAFNNNKAMQRKRKAPSLPMLYWTVDGWDVELLYQKDEINKKGHKVTTYTNRPSAVMILDPFNKYIVGYAIDTHETPDLIKRALRNALNHTQELFGKRYCPYQLQTDNYQKKTLFDIYEASAKIYTPAKVKNAKSKVIEPFFGWFNKEHFQNRLLQNWSGFGIKSKEDNQPNNEYLNAVRHQFPNFQDCIAQIEAAIANDRAKKIDAYMENWTRLPEEDKQEFSTTDYLKFFGEQTGYTNKMVGHGLTPTINGDIISYDCFDHQFRMLSHMDWCVSFDPEDLSKILVQNAKADKNRRLVEIVGTHEFILEMKHTEGMAIYDRTDKDDAEAKRINDFNKQSRQMILGRQEERVKILREFAHQSDNKELETLKKLLISDSNGQNKDRASKARLEDVEDAVVLPIKPTKQEEYEIIEDTRDHY